MICSPCRATKVMPDCLTNIRVGTVGAANTAYYVYIKDNTVNRTERYAATSNGSSVLTIAVTQRLSTNHSYDLWVTLASAASLEDRQDVTISGETEVFQCFGVTFESSFTDASKNGFTTVVLTAS